MAATTAPTALNAEPGSPHPLGATPGPEGVNFSLFSSNATGVELLLFDRHDAPAPSQVIRLDPFVNKSFHFWHVFVRGLRACAHYAFRVEGPFDPAAGQRFDPGKVLVDLYSRGNTDTLWQRGPACAPGDNTAASMRSVVVDPAGYDWEGDVPLNRPMAETVIYEMHARGFTRSPGSGVQQPGSFAGIIEKIPYLQDLGVTAVELLPVFDFDQKGTLREWNGQALTNYWGYSTIGFFAPQCSYCIRPESGSHLQEFRDMVKALHRAGIEIILDVVFNHTDEGNQLGPTFSFKGIDNLSYYLLVPWALQYYMDFSGGPEADRGLPALLGERGPRGWLPLRRRLDSVARRGWPPGDASAGGLADRTGRPTGHDKSDGGGLGRRRAVPGRPLPRRSVGGMERPLPRRHPALRQGRPGRRGGRGRADCGQRGPLPERRPAADQQHQLRELPRRLHTERPGFL
jgi:hypothetical protein